MVMFRLALCAVLLSCSLAWGQTVDGHPAAPASRGLVGTPPPMSRTTPGVGGRGMKPGAKLPPGQIQKLPQPTAAERAEQRKLEHDLHICIGC